MSENPQTQLENNEMMAEMQTLTFAGHETTASTLSWMFWELAKHPEYQERMRKEIREMRAVVTARGDNRFTMEDLDSMTTVMNALKAGHHNVLLKCIVPDLFTCLQETLRIHPIVFHLQRVAVKDDIIPLSEPITSATGEVLNAIPVKAGQWIMASLCGYNRCVCSCVVNATQLKISAGCPPSGVRTLTSGTLIASCISTLPSRPELGSLPTCECS